MSVKIIVGINDLCSTHPDLVKEWDFEQNNMLNIKPDQVSAGSGKKVWWKGKCGHSWQAAIAARACQGQGCPYCSGNKVLKGFNDLATTHPSSLKDWDFEKNNISPDEITSGSGKKVWWKCKNNHSYSMSVCDHVIRKRSCPYCSSHKVLKGYNDFQTKYPELAKEWNYEKNGDLKPFDILPQSNRKVWWKGECGHEWQASVAARVNGNGKCPVCLHRTIVRGVNDLVTTDPELAKEWDYDKNNGVMPYEISSGSNKRYWWKCSKGHEWYVSPASRLKTGSKQLKYTRCPICFNRSDTKLYENSLEYLNPELSAEWDYDKNKDLLPSEVTPGSNKRVWWKGKCGHSWRASIASRAEGRGCPYCSGNKVLKGFNDLASQFPQLMTEWDYEKNTVKPDSITSGSNKKVWWICPKGHSYAMAVKSRTNKDGGCPICSANSTSYPEQFIYWTFKEIFPDTQNRAKVEGYEYDILIPSQRLYIEYSGSYWHEGKEQRSTAKRNVAEKRGGRYIEIMDDHDCKRKFNGQTFLIDNRDIILDSNYDIHKLMINVVNYIAEKYLQISLDNLNFDEIHKKAVEYSKGEIEENISLGTMYPDIAKEWDYEKNKPLKPSDVSFGSKKKIWWICPKGHSYQATPNRRTSMHSGCPYCANKKVIVGYKDIATSDPSLLSQWDYEKNKPLKPIDITSGSKKKVWWICEKGHSYQATPYQKAIMHSKCPYCLNRKLLVGYNDLATTNPELLSEWDYKKNKSLKPTDLTSGSKKKVWWLCKKGHSYQASPSQRTFSHNGCPYCANRKILVGYNDLATTDPQLLSEWDYEKNTDITPQMVTRGSVKKVWWKCPNGHSYETTVNYKTSKHAKCPYCKKLGLNN